MLKNKIMKTLENFAKENNLIVVPINYKEHGIKCKRKGFDLCRPNGQIIATFEPKNYRYSNEKWLVISGSIYSHVTRITKKLLKNLDLSIISYCYNSKIWSK